MDEAALHELLSGRRRDIGARLLRCGLELASWGYSSAMSLRNLAYRREWLRIHRASVPVISLGNITTGGTGKTPLAAWLANWLVAEGYQPGILSRGYRTLDQGSMADSVGTRKRDMLKHNLPAVPELHRAIDIPILNPLSDAREPAVPGNDEKLVLDRLCPGVPHLQRRDRVNSARQAIGEFGCDVLLLDDGFQHRRLHRDLDLVLIDALQPWGYGHVLPRGLLREPVAGLRRADLVLITRANQCSTEQRQTLRTELQRIRGSDECIEVAFVPRQLVDQNWQSHSLGSVAGKKAFSFCGIGNPTGFSQTLASLEVTCGRTHVFSDHHHYDELDLSKLADFARDLCAEVVFTTQKDLVKIPLASWHGPPLFAVEIGVEFVNGAELLELRLRQLFDRTTEQLANSK